VSDPIGDHHYGEAFGVANGFVAGETIAHHARQLQHFGYPASVIFAIQVDTICANSSIGTRVPRKQAFRA